MNKLFFHRKKKEGIIELCSCQHALSYKRREEHSLRQGYLLLSSREHITSSISAGQAVPACGPVHGTVAQSHWGNVATPSELGMWNQEGRAWSQRVLFLSFNVLWNLLCWVLDFLGTCGSLFLADFSLWEWECLSYACPTIAFQKQITCLVSQIHRWNFVSVWILCWISLTLIQMIFAWELWLKSWCWNELRLLGCQYRRECISHVRRT